MIRVVSHVSVKSRARRGRLFVSSLLPRESDRILDLGGGDGAYFASVLPYRSNVCVADISADALAQARRRGFDTAVIAESGPLPFPDGHFDVVFCSSAIEHATVDKADLRTPLTNREFRRIAYSHQLAFAREIRRLGKRYFVQTPNRYFPIETHSWLPFVVVFLPRSLQIDLIDFMNRWWPKKTKPDWSLLTRRQMTELFPDARIVTERWLGLPKSIIAIKG